MAQKVTHMISTRNILNRATYGFKRNTRNSHYCQRGANLVSYILNKYIFLSVTSAKKIKNALKNNQN